MKQTAVEWLLLRISIAGVSQGTGLYLDELLDQAKQMEKDQIIDSFGVGCQVESTRLIGYQDIAEQYYNETYGKE